MEQGSSLSLISLNIEGHKHLSERVIPFLKNSQPEVILLQEVFFQDLKLLSARLGVETVFAPMCLRPLAYGERGEFLDWGLAVLSRLSIVECEAVYYVGSPRNLPMIDPTLHQSDADLEARALLCVGVKKNNKLFNLATTHFTWTPDGQPSDQQRHDLPKLCQALAGRELTWTGDTNAPRYPKSGEIWNQLSQRFIDWIPSNVTTTLDRNLHRAGDLQLVVDALFTTNGYQAQNIQVIDGLSDHCAIVANIYKLT